MMKAERPMWAQTSTKSLVHKSGAPSIIKRGMERVLTGKVAQWLFDGYFHGVLRGRVIGVENIPEGGCILAFNHSSYLDWLAVYHIFAHHYHRPIYFLAKAKLQSNPVWNIYLNFAHAIVVDYDHFSTIKGALRVMSTHLQQGHLVGIFPEGTRSPDGHLLDAHDGAIWLAERANVPIVPIGLQGFYRAWPRHRVLPGIARCTINIGKPLVFEKNMDADRQTRRRQMKIILMKRICEMLDRC